MRKLHIGVLVAIIILSAPASAQEAARSDDKKPAPPEPKIIRLSPEHQKELIIKGQQVDLAEANLRRAQSEFREWILRLRLTLGMPEDKFAFGPDSQGQWVFVEKVQTPEPGKPAGSKPEPKKN